jgi:hypothetical protein|tara:strand:- start:1186 stop:2121 length:936 start_codon:yes stop_codon:yes gene_type:complete
MDKVFYNKSSQDSLGWEPSWFGCDYNDDDLVAAIKKWQKDNGLTADGLVGPMTFRRVWTEREADISDHIPYSSPYLRGDDGCDDKKYIVHNGKFLEIDWQKVVLWDDPDGLGTKRGTYYSYAGKPDREPTMFVNHWDVCLSSESCANVLARRGISVHFCIDNDGTIYQLLDTQHGAWHAGIGKVNHRSVGVEISNAYYPKYQAWYKKNGFGERPMQDLGNVHGKTLDPFLDFYPVQIEALKALWKAIHKGIGIPLETPEDEHGTSTTVDSKASRGTFKGFVSHYHLTSRKIDCAGLDICKLLDEAKEEIGD